MRKDLGDVQTGAEAPEARSQAHLAPKAGYLANRDRSFCAIIAIALLKAANRAADKKGQQQGFGKATKPQVQGNAFLAGVSCGEPANYNHTQKQMSGLTDNSQSDILGLSSEENTLPLLQPEESTPGIGSDRTGYGTDDNTGETFVETNTNGDGEQPEVLLGNVNTEPPPQGPDLNQPVSNTNTDTLIGGEARVGETDSLTGGETGGDPTETGPEQNYEDEAIANNSPVRPEPVGNPVRPEPVEGPNGPQDTPSNPAVRPEPVEGLPSLQVSDSPSPHETPFDPSTGSGRTVFSSPQSPSLQDTPSNPAVRPEPVGNPVRPEPVEGPNGIQDSPSNPAVRPEPVEGLPSLQVSDSTSPHETPFALSGVVGEARPEGVGSPQEIEEVEEEIYGSGVFEVSSEDGEVGFDFLYDGGWYQGEVIVFGIRGLGKYRTNSIAFIKEVLRRSLGLSDEPGEIALSDIREGSRFKGDLGEQDQNRGEYQGIRRIQLERGDKFGLALIPHGSAQELLDLILAAEAAGEADPLKTIRGNLHPLFSMNIANPEGVSHIGRVAENLAADDLLAEGQIADVTGDGHTFVLEDLRADRYSDRDYNDLIFQVRGAKAKTPHMSDLLPETEEDWRDTDLGEALIDYAEVAVQTTEDAQGDAGGSNGDSAADADILDVSSAVETAIENAANLDNYDPEELADITKWVVVIDPELNPDSIALLLGAENEGSTGHIDNTYIFSFPEDTPAEEVKKLLAELEGAGSSYPLVPLPLVYGPIAPQDPLFDRQWHLDNSGENGTGGGGDLNIADAWYQASDDPEKPGTTLTGQGTVIGIVDSGVQGFHPDLAENFFEEISKNFAETDPSDLEEKISLQEEWWGWGWPWWRPVYSYWWGWRWASEIGGLGQGQEQTQEAPDPLQHGTSVAGIAAGASNDEGVSGVAPGAKFASLGLTAEEVTDQQIADALSHERDVIDIFNNSWKPGKAQLAAPGSLTQLENGVKFGRPDDKGNPLGNIYVFAAGNDAWAGENVNYNPFANSRFTIAVGAIDHNGEQTFYSEPGASLLVSAYSSSAYIDEEESGIGHGALGIGNGDSESSPESSLLSPPPESSLLSPPPSPESSPLSPPPSPESSPSRILPPLSPSLSRILPPLSLSRILPPLSPSLSLPILPPLS
ncbi:MAG: S8 family serine peptidase, partial [Oscillatoria sp. SIO1A7]|nr:S8 family serine peptidase [Oscillatoria sp. SIO1A7]